MNRELVMHVTDVNRHSHTDNIVRHPRYSDCATLLTPGPISQKRQKGGIGSAAYDPKQKDIRAFFGGKAEPPPESDISAHEKVAGEEDIVE